MARPSSQSLTDREAQLMEILWSEGSCTAEAVRELLPDRPHDSTVRTLLRILAKKRYVRIRRKKPAVYEPIVSRSVVQSSATRSLLARFFAGSVDALVMRLIEDEQLSPQQLARLRKSLSRRKQ